MTRHVLAVSLAVLLLPPAQSGLGQQPRPEAGVVDEGDTAETVNPLASKEEMIRDRFQRFEDRVYRLRDQLKDVEPDNAARLGRALQRGGELGLADRLDEMVELLRDPSSLTEATDVQAQWLSDVDRLLAVLLERDSGDEERKREIERLQEYRDRVGKILEDQRELRNATAERSATEGTGRQLDQAIQRINDLLDRQAEIMKGTQRASDNTSKADAKTETPRLSERQEGLSRDTTQLGDDLRQLGASDSDRSAEDSSTQSMPGETKAAAEAVDAGARAMSESSQSLRQGDASSALPRQQQAAEALREARRRLEEAKRQLGQTADTPQLAEEQQQIADETGALSDQMQQDASKEEGSEGQSGGQQGSSAPGQQSLDKAQSEMKDASQSLGQSNPREATPSQDRAIDELEQAKKELEEALNQLRQEQREETLRDLEARFREMLSKQRAINDATVRLDRIGSDDFQRAERLELADLSTRQRALSEDAATCLHILDEDGTTIAFPRVMEQLSDDMGTVSDRLADYLVGILTQTIEREIVETLEQLLEAVQRMQQENEQPGMSEGNMSDGPTALLPPSAELKLLRSSQLRVNTRTTVIETSRAEGTEPAKTLDDALRKVAGRQNECAEIARDMRDRQHQP